MKKTLGRVGLVAAMALAATAIPAGASWAAPDTRLTLHYYSAGNQHRPDFRASTLDGAAAIAGSSTSDGLWTTEEFTFPGAAADAYLGFVVAGDGTFSTDKRYVRATNGEAAAWIVDGDARVYGQPQKIDPATIVKKHLEAYVAVDDLPASLGVTATRGTNGYVFDGKAAGSLDILTLRDVRDYVEIATATNRIGSNVTGNMLAEYTDQVFSDVDGFAANGTYYLSFDAIERLFQVGTLVTDDGEYVLPRTTSAYDTVEKAAKPEDVGFDSAKLAALDDYLNDQMAQGASSLALSVVKDGKLVKESAYGYAKKYDTPLVDGTYQPAQLLPKDQWQPATVDTLYDLASNTKMYATNYAIQQLVSDGKLDLDRTLQSFPGWENFTDANSVYTGKWTVGGTGGIKAVRTGKETVTIRDILHHEGGLIPDPEYPNRTSAGALYYQSSDISDRSGIVDIISKTPLMYQPRTAFAYSDVDFMILGLLVEQISGTTLDTYFADNIAAPLGLAHTTYRPLDHGFRTDQIAPTELNGNTRDGNVSFGTLDDGTPVPMRTYTLQGEVHDEKAFYTMGGVAGHAGLFSTVGDMAALTQLMLNGGIYNGHQLFTQEVANEFTTPHAVDPAKVDAATVGLGWRVHSKSASAYYYFNWGPSRSSYGHQGWTGTLTIIDPVQNMTITILSNFRHSPVVSPPNGFGGAAFDIADLVPVSARVYNALQVTDKQYSPVVSVAPVAPVTVRPGTPAAEALAALAATTTVTDAAGRVHTVPLAWSVDGFTKSKPGQYTAHATVVLPATVVQAEPAVSLDVTTTVTVKAGHSPE